MLFKNDTWVVTLVIVAGFRNKPSKVSLNKVLAFVMGPNKSGAAAKVLC